MSAASARNPRGFQERVDELMTEGLLFGEAVLQARHEFADALASGFPAFRSQLEQYASKGGGA